MKESSVVLKITTDELKEYTDIINKYKNCPHCGKPLDIGSLGGGQHVVGCYHNPDCPFKTEQEKGRWKEPFRIDLYVEHKRKNTLERELVIIRAHQFFEDAEQLGDLGEIDQDKFENTAKTVKTLYDEVARMWRAVNKDDFEGVD